MAKPPIQRGLQGIVVAGEDGNSVGDGPVSGKGTYEVRIGPRCCSQKRRELGLIDVDVPQQMRALCADVADLNHGVRHDLALNREVVIEIAGNLESWGSGCDQRDWT